MAKPKLSLVEERGNPENIAASLICMGGDSQVRSNKGPRASSLNATCARMLVLTHNNPVTETIDLGTRITFGIGNAVHSWIQNSDALFLDYQRFGLWQCGACGHTYPFGCKPKTLCVSCGAFLRSLNYYELPISTKAPYPCSGHPDLFLKTQKMLRIVEVKTISATQFPELVAPLVDHLWQIQYYMWACGKKESEFPIKFDKRVGYVLYLSKGHHRDSLPVKMFAVTRDKAVIKAIKTKLKSFHLGVTEGVLPAPEHECLLKEFTSYQARDCPARQECRARLE